MTTPAKRTACLKVKRGGPGDAARYDVFSFDFEPGQSVLDALRWVRGNVDPSLAIRFSCINANACKECMVRLNGKPVYACIARLVEGEMLVEPLQNKRVIRDLVTDIVPPAERLD